MECASVPWTAIQHKKKKVEENHSGGDAGIDCGSRRVVEMDGYVL